jgi:Mlc titration factor MtfA (ptsG expression regulator)
MSKILLIPCFIGLGLIIYLSYNYDEHLSIWAVPFVLMGALLLVFSPQVDWWWFQKHPPRLESEGIEILANNCPYYQNLNTKNKKLFEQRVAMYIKAIEFIPKFAGKEEDEGVPYDLKIITVSNPVQLTFGLKDFIIPKFETVVLFPKPFPTPDFPTKKHASELNLEDKTFIFSIEQMLWGFKTPTSFYNIGLHEFAKAFILSRSSVQFPELKEQNWEDLQSISTWSKEDVESVVGLPGEVDVIPAAIHHFFIFPQQFNARLPEVFQLFSNIFNQDTRNTESPVVDSF